MMYMHSQSPGQPTENLDEQPNPMVNPNILQSFFEAIPFDFRSFKNYRLVCKSWLIASIPRWRRSAWLALEDTKLKNSHMTIQELQKMMASPKRPHELVENHPFRRYKLRLANGLLLTDEYEHRNSSENFWTKLGHHMTHLKIFETKILSSEDLRQVLLEMTPNLRFLSFQNNSFMDQTNVSPWRNAMIPIPFPLTEQEWIGRIDPPWRNEWGPTPSQLQTNLSTIELCLGSGEMGFDFPMAWVYFLSRFPNIRAMKLREMSQWCRRGSYYKELKLFLNSILHIREKCDRNFMADLQELDILHEKQCVGKFGDYCLSLHSLQSLRFPLQSLALDIGFAQDEAGFKEILDLYSSTLEKLLAYRGPCPSIFNIEVYAGLFPFGVELPHLTELRLIGTICKNLNFMINLPNLRVLVLLELTGKREMEPEVLHLYVDFWKDNLVDKVSPSQTEYGIVQKVIASTDFFWKELHSRVLFKMEEFIIGHEKCTAKQVECLGRLMPNLRKLRLGLDSNGFMLACHVWKKLEHLDLEPFDVEDDAIFGIVEGELYHNPNLTDLKYLKSFRIGSEADGDRKRVSERLLRQITRALKASGCVKDLYFAVTPRNWKGFGGNARDSPMQIMPNLADGFHQMKI